tara:strand:- start:572 stop:712 length:141 start_codon:yes stop_codon:yes gene_type:complete
MAIKQYWIRFKPIEFKTNKELVIDLLTEERIKELRKQIEEREEDNG